jgi:hypothetical protein
MKRFGEHPPDQGISLDRAAHVLGASSSEMLSVLIHELGPLLEEENKKRQFY